MISCDLLYIRAIKYYKLPMINPEIATSLKLWSFSLCSALPCCLICKCRQRKKITARCHQCMGKLAETCPGNPLLSLIIWSGFTFLLRSEFGDQCDPEHEKNRPPATTIWDFSIAPENLDDLFRISTFALQNCWCTSGEKKKKRWNKARPNHIMKMWELFSVLKVPVQSLVAFSAGKLHLTSELSFGGFYFCILSSWQQGQVLHDNQCSPCIQVPLLRNKSLFILFVKLQNLMWGVQSLFLVASLFLTLILLQYCCLLSESRVGPR